MLLPRHWASWCSIMDAEVIFERMVNRFAKKAAIRDGLSWRDNPTKPARKKRQEKYIKRYRARLKAMRVKELVQVLQLADRALSQAIVVKVPQPARNLCRQASREIETLVQELGAKEKETRHGKEEEDE